MFNRFGRPDVDYYYLISPVTCLVILPKVRILNTEMVIQHIHNLIDWREDTHKR